MSLDSTFVAKKGCILNYSSLFQFLSYVLGCIAIFVELTCWDCEIGLQAISLHAYQYFGIFGRFNNDILLLYVFYAFD